MPVGTPVEMAASGRALLQEAVLAKLAEQPMTNAELAKALNLPSAHEGRHKNWLTWMILGDLLRDGKVSKTRIAVKGEKRRTEFALVKQASAQ
jgi:hypothetical protein